MQKSSLLEKSGGRGEMRLCITKWTFKCLFVKQGCQVTCYSKDLFILQCICVAVSCSTQTAFSAPTTAPTTAMQYPGCNVRYCNKVKLILTLNLVCYMTYLAYKKVGSPGIEPGTPCTLMPSCTCDAAWPRSEQWFHTYIGPILLYGHVWCSMLGLLWDAECYVELW